MNSTKPLKDAFERLEEEKTHKILSVLPRQHYFDIVFMAKQIFSVPIAFISLIDKNMQWFKSGFGMREDVSEHCISFCDYSLEAPKQFFEVPDVSRDLRFIKKQLTNEKCPLRFFASIPLVNSKGESFGSFCLLDSVEKSLSDTQKKMLASLARQIVVQLEMRKCTKKLELQQKALEMRLKDGKSELEDYKTQRNSLYFNAPDMMVSVDPRTKKIVECNKMLLNKLGYTRQELIETEIFKLYHPESHEKAYKLFAQFKIKGEISNEKLILRTKNGTKMPITLNVSSVRDSKGEILHSISTWRDSTEMIKVENSLKEENGKLEEKVSHHTEALLFANKKLENISYLAKHNLIAPLEGIEQHFSAIQSKIEDIDRETEESTEFIHNSIEEMKFTLDAFAQNLNVKANETID